MNIKNLILILILIIGILFCIPFISASNDTFVFNLTSNITMNTPNQEAFFGFINQYILILLILIIYCIAAFSEPLLGFVGIVISFIGIITTINYSFAFGSIFVILLIAGFFIAVREE